MWSDINQILPEKKETVLNGCENLFYLRSRNVGFLLYRTNPDSFLNLSNKVKL
jgi:hypothetical protein